MNSLYGTTFNFYFIGNGQLKKDVVALTKQIKSVFMYEVISSIANKLHHFDFVLMPSRCEGLPLVSIEASFAKVSVIASRAPSLEETLPENWALWFDLSNEEELLIIFENSLFLFTSTIKT